MTAPLLKKFLRGFSLTVCALAANAASAGDFNARMAAWQNGSRQAAPATAVPGTAADAADEAMPLPAQMQPSEQYLPAYGNPYPSGMPFDSYGCDTCGTVGGTGCGLLCGGGCTLLAGAGCGGVGCGDICGPSLWWTRLELLMHWRQGRDFPALVTTDPADEDPETAGILPDATVLFGLDRETSQVQPGMRLDFGTWLDPSQCIGIGNRFFFLGKDSIRFSRSSAENAVLGIPFFSELDEENSGLLISFPDLLEGRVDINGSNEVFGNDVYAKFLVCRTNSGRIDLITGYHFSRINDFLRIESRSAITDIAGELPLGTTSRTFDRFDTRNEFHGGILGFSIQHEYCCWSVQSQMQIAFGSMHQRAAAFGASSITVPGDDPTFAEGGVFTTETNIGQIEQDEFCVVPEAAVTLGYRVRPGMELTFGYSFAYWSDVARAGNVIDQVVGLDDGATRPVLAFSHSDFWIQGLNFGVSCEF